MKKNWKNLPGWLKIVAFIFLFLFSTEMILRFIFGLGDLVVYREDKEYEYFYQANQEVWRYGNHIVTNEFGMRSKKFNKKKKVTILEFGDSVLNGGSHVDQDKLATTREETELNKQFNNEVQILNISAQSWGVSNAFAFLKKHGNFNAKIFVLVFSSHDLNDNMHFRKVVGSHPAWPDAKPMLAITDAWTRYLWPKTKSFFTGESEYDYLKGFDDSKVNPGWESFFNYCREKKIPLLIYLHASKTEMLDKKYNDRGKKIIEMCKKNNITVITDINNVAEDSFIDDIHMNENGHKIMADRMLPVLVKTIAGLRL